MYDYWLGQLIPIARKSVEPIAPAQITTKHQSLLKFCGNTPWPGAAMLARARELMLRAIERSAPMGARIIGEMGLPKKGWHSVGMNRQYCVQLRLFRDEPLMRVADAVRR
jgi:SRSO17 transposase